jgi:hypothetical protein
LGLDRYHTEILHAREQHGLGTAVKLADIFVAEPPGELDISAKPLQTLEFWPTPNDRQPGPARRQASIARSTRL